MGDVAAIRNLRPVRGLRLGARQHHRRRGGGTRRTRRCSVADAHVGKPAAYVDQLLIAGEGGADHIWACDHFKTTLDAPSSRRPTSVARTW